MSLTDVVAARVMGEIHTLTLKIDDQHNQIIDSTGVFVTAAKRIRRNSEIAVENARIATEQAQLEGIANFQSSMSEAVARTLNEVAGAVATRAAVQWIIGGVVLAGVLAIFAGWMGYTKGKDAGNALGYAMARDEVAAATWANTPDGKLAYLLSKAGSIEKLALCNGIGWKIENGVCFVHEKDGDTHGWRLP